MRTPNGRVHGYSKPAPHRSIRMAAMVCVITVFVGLDFLELGRTTNFHDTRVVIESNADKNANKIKVKYGDLFQLKREVSHGISKSNGTRHNNENLFPETSEQSTSKTEFAGNNLSKNDVEAINSAKPKNSQHLAFTHYGGSPWKHGIGNWLKRCWSISEPILVLEDVYGKRCPKNCRSSGVCNNEFGQCRCRSGYNGTDCSGFDDHPCNMAPMDLNVTVPWIWSACPAVCDHRTSQCVCGPGSEHPYRPLQEPCGLTATEFGLVFNEENRLFLYGNTSDKMGWCNADAEKVRRGEQIATGTCGCAIDGRDGEYCDEHVRAYCIGGCNGHGKCHSGYCECNDGWYGIDCSIPSIKTRMPYKYTPPWLRADNKISQRSSKETKRKLLEKKSMSKRRTWKTVWTNKQKKVRHAMRRRPLIYVYDLPGEFTFHHFEGRQIRANCVPWMYTTRNETEFQWSQLYGMEPVVLEGLLASPHRTTNAEEADYFYVPHLNGCLLSRVDQTPPLILEGYDPRTRPHLTMEHVFSVYEYIRDNFPYWNRSRGHDHIWMFPWDEGACYAPEAIWNSTMLSPWGNTMAHHNYSTTAYGPDKWDRIPKSLRGSHPCFDPVKDIVMPNWKPPNVQLLQGRLWERSYEDRTTLFYFTGALGANYTNSRPEADYSMGIRQKVSKYFGSTPNKYEELGELHSPGVVVSNKLAHDYSEQLSSSKFCGVFPGDGFSARMEDSILHGCIPVIIQDGIQMAFENVLEYSEFAVRITEDNIPEMVNILKAISESEVRAKLESIKSLWQRWAYSSVHRMEAERQLDWHGHKHVWGEENEKLTDDDAMATLMQILHYKLYNDPWRKSPMGIELMKQKKTGLPAECFLEQRA